MGLQAAVGAFAVAALNRAIGLEESAWAVVACTYVVAATATGTMERVRRRIVGTLIGGAGRPRLPADCRARAITDLGSRGIGDDRLCDGVAAALRHCMWRLCLHAGRDTCGERFTFDRAAHRAGLGNAVGRSARSCLRERRFSPAIITPRCIDAIRSTRNSVSDRAVGWSGSVAPAWRATCSAGNSPGNGMRKSPSTSTLTTWTSACRSMRIVCGGGHRVPRHWGCRSIAMRDRSSAGSSQISGGCIGMSSLTTGGTSIPSMPLIGRMHGKFRRQRFARCLGLSRAGPP